MGSFLRFSLRNAARFHSRTAAPTATTLDVLGPDGKNKITHISSYSTKGFTINGIRVVGSVALFKNAIIHWKITDPSQINPETLALFHLFWPPIEVLVLGVGDKITQMDEALRKYARTKGLGLEIQDTPNACATFNFLMDEGRQAAAALIPPKSLNK
ncbi:NADH dehydrogenase [ubiquinone] 1 alpha subcomplex assembly factor 3-like [Oscarella lobularis]|uniref:NADH dehydrogenase [ubiquinone] 1 alpha subcomplex assembly factor 3-like n=1 Tax=Oscarella lobularis TaxID=121494 RepID=UPI003313259D